MNLLLWVLQVVIGLFFVITGVQHFVMPEGLPSLLEWMYDLSDPIHYVAGTAEILGGLGLILPGLTRIQTRLTPLAAGGLALVMLSAAVWHIGRGEVRNVVTNLVVAAAMGFIAYGRTKLAPLPDRRSSAS